MTLEPLALRELIFDEAKKLQWLLPVPGELLAPRITADQTGGTFSITEAVIAPQAGPPLHIHWDADEWIYVLEGRLHFVSGQDRFEIGAGDLVGVPRGTPHAFRNLSDQSARILGILSPAGFEQLFFAMKGRPPEDIAKLGPQYGLEVVGPPIDGVEGLHVHAEAAG
jgi:mannose-6-phosphate isomerase-like protein (cupin superfamily)